MSRNVPSDLCANRRFRSACALRSLLRILTKRIWIAKDAKFFHVDNEDAQADLRLR